MLISKKKNFIFVHIKKTAGSSITRCLTRYDDRSLYLKLLNTKFLTRLKMFRDMNPLSHHVPAYKIRDYLGERYDDFFKFAFVRNPFDWQVSNYFFVKQSKMHPRHKEVKNLTFNEYLEWTLVNGRINLQSMFISDENNINNIIVDYVGKFENINDDFNHIMRCIGIADEVDLKHTNRSLRKSDYRQYYDDYSRTFIEQHYHSDLTNFDYTFNPLFHVLRLL